MGKDIGKNNKKTAQFDGLGSENNLTDSIIPYESLSDEVKSFFNILANQEQEWGIPKSLDIEDIPFPKGIFPDWLENMIERITLQFQVPRDLPAMIALSILSTVAAKKYKVQVRSGWLIPVNLYIAIALQPGGRKTPVFNAMSYPIRNFQIQEQKRTEEAIKIAEEQLKSSKEILEMRLQQAKKDAAKQKEIHLRLEVEEEVKRLSEELAAVKQEEEKLPSKPRLLAEDASLEKLAQLMMENHERISVLSAEGNFFEHVVGKYSDKSNTGLIKKAKDGEYFIEDRMHRVGSTLNEPALTIGVCTQPSVIKELCINKDLRGQGVLARFLYSIPKDTLGRRKINAPPTPKETKEIYYEKIMEIMQRPWNRDCDGKETHYILNFSQSSNDLMIKLEEHIEPMLHPIIGELNSISDWAAKLCGEIAKIAALIHLADDQIETDSVNVKSMEKAMILVDYFIFHARKAFNNLDIDQAIFDAKYTLNAILSKSETDVLKYQQIWQWTKGKLKEAERLQNALSILDEYGYIASVKYKNSVGRNGNVYKLNPKIKDYKDYNDLIPLLESDKGDNDQDPKKDLKDYNNLNVKVNSIHSSILSTDKDRENLIINRTDNKGFLHSSIISTRKEHEDLIL